MTTTTEALTLLRIVLGEQSEAVWSNADLSTLLDFANKNIWRQAVTLYPGGFRHRVDFSVNDTTLGVGNELPERDIDVTDSDFIGRRVMMVERVYEQKGTFPNQTVDEFILITTDSIHEGDHFGIVGFGDLKVPAALTARQAIWDYAEQKITFMPPLKESTGLSVWYIPEEPASAISFSSAPNAELLDGKARSIHRAVIFEAAFIATFKDKSLRAEFEMERDRAMQLLGDSPLTVRETD